MDDTKMLIEQHVDEITRASTTNQGVTMRHFNRLYGLYGQEFLDDFKGKTPEQKLETLTAWVLLAMLRS
jgi:hypothetical protein